MPGKHPYADAATRVFAAVVAQTAPNNELEANA
jgi:hypothetical protein